MDTVANRKSIVVGLSGGVDSAVAALLLKREGYDVHAVFMKNWSEDDFGGPCPWAEDQESAIAVAGHLNIPLETWNFEQEYRDRVFKVMLHEYEQGRTPNPDILCNREIKFDLFLERAMLVAPMIATGHYAKTRDGKLFKAKDGDKDQSYFLAGITSAALKKTVFPLGGITKPEVRRLAKETGLPNWDRPDSTGICFIGEQPMFNFLSRYIKPQPGPIVLNTGQAVGQHQGLQFYTIGQRHGFGAGLDQAAVAKVIGPGKPLFVKEKISDKNTLVIAPADQPEVLSAKSFSIEGLHWITPPATWPWAGTAKLRYRQPDVPVKVQIDDRGVMVVCDQPQRAITPGQYAVFYQGEECLGCAVISQAHT